MSISAKQTLEISKTVVANLFGVSRSAVSQSCSRRTVENDVLMRVYKYIMDRTPNESVRMHVAQAVSVELLQILRKITEIRDRKRTSAGRPPKKVNFRAFKSLIRAVVAEITEKKAIVNAIRSSSVLPSAEKEVIFSNGGFTDADVDALEDKELAAFLKAQM